MGQARRLIGRVLVRHPATDQLLMVGPGPVQDEELAAAIRNPFAWETSDDGQDDDPAELERLAAEKRTADEAEARRLLAEAQAAQAAHDSDQTPAGDTHGPAGEGTGGPSSPVPEGDVVAPSYDDLDREQLVQVAATRELEHRANASADTLRKLLADDDAAQTAAETQKAPDSPQE